MPRPRQVTDEQILDAARRVFIEQGPVSTAVVAKEVGVSAAALFKRFGTKDELMLRALAPDPSPIFQVMAEPPSADRPIQEQLEDVAHGIASALVRILPCVMALKAANLDIQALHTFKEPPPVAAHRRLTNWLEQAQKLGLLRADKQPATMAYCLMGALQSRMMTTLLSSGEPAFDHEYPKEVVEILFRGLEPEVA